MEQVTARVWTDTTLRGCNPSYVVTDDGVVVVDTPQLPTHALEMRSSAEEHGPIRYVVNTEHHVDHIFGNYYFRGAGHVVHHRGVHDNYMETTPDLDSFAYAAEAVAEDDRAGLEFLPDRAAYFEDPNDGDIVFDGDLTLRVGTTTLELIHTPGHTPGQIAVLVPDERVVFTGDTVFSSCQTWLMNSNITEWLVSLDRVAALDVDIVVPGHGPVMSIAGLGQQRAVLHEWVDAVRRAISCGWTREEVVERVNFADRFPVDVGQGHMMDFVQRLNAESLWDKLSAGAEP